MKARLFLFILIAMVAISCSNGSAKFIGKWKPMTHHMFSDEAVLSIEKQGDTYLLTNSRTPDEPIILSYADKDDKLRGSIRGLSVSLTYDDNTGHMWFRTNIAAPTEFEKQ